MSADPAHRTVIVAAVDGMPSSRDVVRVAVAAARGFPAGEIHYLHVAEPPMTSSDRPLPAYSTNELVADGKRILAEVVRETASRFVGRVETHVAVGFAARAILQLAADLDADLIVVGSHARSWLGRMVFGSVARTVLGHAHCAVLVARPAEPWADDGAGLIESPCKSCHATQHATHGAQLWCEHHRARSVAPHIHYRPITLVAVAELATGAAE